MDRGYLWMPEVKNLEFGQAKFTLCRKFSLPWEFHFPNEVHYLRGVGSVLAWMGHDYLQPKFENLKEVCDCIYGYLCVFFNLISCVDGKVGQGALDEIVCVRV